MDFKKVTLENVCELKPFFEKYKSPMCEFTIGEKYMWRNIFSTEYAIEDTSLFTKEIYSENKQCFYLPLGGNLKENLNKVNKYALANHINLELACLDISQLEMIGKLYPHSTSFYNRDWSDYLYDVTPMQTFKGKHLSGKRYYLNKFLAQNPSYQFKIAGANDIEKLKEFYAYDETKINFDNPDEITEYKISLDLIENFIKLNQVCGYILVGDKIVSYAIGEIVGQVLFIHVEKALTSYEGSFQIIVREFAKAFGINGVKYINREDDDGDLGLRTSKEQYHPLKMEDKYFLKVNNNIDLIDELPTIKLNDDYSLTPIYQTDKKNYYLLSVDDKLNQYWGYDYRTDIPESEVNQDNIYQMLCDDFDKKDDVSFAVRYKGQLVGEVVFHNIKPDNSSEIGIRLFSKYQSRGIGSLSLKKASEFAFKNLNYNYLSAKCYKPNLASYRCLEKAGFKKTGEDETFFYFVKVSK